MTVKNAFYAQSGGVTAVINASACGVIETAARYPDAIGKVYAGNNGIIGALREDLIDTSRESAEAVIRWARVSHCASSPGRATRASKRSLVQVSSPARKAASMRGRAVSAPWMWARS